MSKTTDGTRIVHGVHAGNRMCAAELYWHGFGQKLGMVMGPHDRAIAFVADVMSTRHVICALGGRGQLLGLVGYRVANAGFVGGGYRDLRRHYGRIGGLWRFAAFLLVADELPDGVMDVDGIVVDHANRGGGIGRALMCALADHARSAGYTHLRLTVTAQNRGARALYADMGFRIVRETYNPLVGFVFGFSRSYTMQLPL